MKNLFAYLLLGVSLASGYTVYNQLNPSPAAPAPPANPTPAPPSPCPGPGPCPTPQPPPHRPWGPRLEGLVRPLRPRPRPFGNPTVGGPVGPGGVEVMCDLPVALRKKNIGGIDGAGLCVFTSIMHSARYQHELKLWNFQEQMSHELGGGYPGKVDKMIAKYAPGTHYLQYEGNDPAILELALKTSRMPAVTYDGRDPHYGTATTVAHMVNCVYLDDKTGCVLDNNFIGDDELVWMTRDEFLDRWKGGDPRAWAVILLHVGPPPVPVSPK